MLLAPPIQLPIAFFPYPHLAGTLAHLTTLASETAHALLLPLLAHTRRDVEGDLEFFILFEAFGTVENFPGTLEGKGARRQELLVLNHRHEGFDRRRGVDFVDRIVDKDLHNFVSNRLLRPVEF